MPFLNSAKVMMTAIVATTEGRRWRDSADAWNSWAADMADPADRINGPLLDLAAAPPGARVLDLAAGVGEPSLTQARRLNGDGLVVASDLVPAMLAGLGARTAAHPYPPLRVAADMMALPFATAAADRVLCRFGLMFVPDPALALAEMRRVLRPGGIAALAVWGPRAQNSLFDLLGLVLTRDHAPQTQALLAPLFRFADPAIPLDLAQTAGFTTATAQVLSLTTPAKAERPFWLPTLEMAFSPLLARLDTHARAALHAEIVKAVADRTDDQGRFVVQMQVNLLCLHV